MKKNPILKKFGSRIRKIRESRGLSQEKLAFMAGFHRTYIGGIERGERNPTLLSVKKIADALKVELTSLFD